MMTFVTRAGLRATRILFVAGSVLAFSPSSPAFAQTAVCGAEVKQDVVKLLASAVDDASKLAL
jgi:hypothetical protein